MQVFIPYPKIERCVQVLDKKRLGKQRVECLQLLNAMTYRKTNDLFKENGRKRGWLNHKCTLMWVGAEQWLRHYAYQCCIEWQKRGYVDNLANTFMLDMLFCEEPLEPPVWWGREDIHKSHRDRLIQKDPMHYLAQFRDSEYDLDADYVWVLPEGVHKV
jgi:hypothetical protein